MRNVSDRSYRENQNILCSVFFLNCTFYDIMWKNIVEPGRQQMTIWRTRISCWIPKATNTQTLRLCNTPCFFHCNNGCTNEPQRCDIRTLPVLLELISKVWQLRPVNHRSIAVLGIESSGARTAQLCHHSCPLQTSVLQVVSKHSCSVCVLNWSTE